MVEFVLQIGCSVRIQDAGQVAGSDGGRGGLLGLSESLSLSGEVAIWASQVIQGEVSALGVALFGPLHEPQNHEGSCEVVL